MRSLAPNCSVTSLDHRTKKFRLTVGTAHNPPAAVYDARIILVVAIRRLDVVGGSMTPPSSSNFASNSRISPRPRSKTTPRKKCDR